MQFAARTKNTDGFSDIEGTPISSAINRVSGWLRRLLIAKTEAVPADHETPIEGAGLISYSDPWN
jgi:hypothetical protein